MKKMRVKLTFIEEFLGTASPDAKIHERFIASKSPDAKTLEEEVEAVGVDAVVQAGKTVIPKDENGNPFTWDYQIKGFFKESAGFVKKFGNSFASSKLSAHKKKIDGGLFIVERKIPFVLPDGGEIGDCQRSLRGQTAKGERTAIADSETVPAGSTLEFTIEIWHTDITTRMVKEWLNYGERHGLGQWRNSGKGRFTWELISEETIDIE